MPSNLARLLAKRMVYVGEKLFERANGKQRDNTTVLLSKTHQVRKFFHSSINTGLIGR